MSETPTPDPSWAIREPVRITLVQYDKQQMIYLVERTNISDEFCADCTSVAVVLEFREETMLINGQFIDVGDDYISYVSMLEEVSAQPGYPNPGTSWQSEPFRDEEG
jgi:hypothetical protein